MKLLFAAALALALGPSAWAQHGVAGLTNPYNTKEDVAAGGRIFHSHCAVCHGPDGAGGRGADLTQGRFRYATSDQDLFGVISEGIPGTEMPGVFFDGRQMWQLVAFVRSLSEGKAASQAKGDSAAGEKLFFGKGGCQSCHMVDGTGSRTGPDLSDIGAQRSLAHLESSILRPNEKVLPQHWFIEGKTKAGKKVFGRRLNEDTYSIQILDSDQRLVSYQKDDLAEYEVLRKSTMPSFEGRFTPKEFEDLVAFLANLRQ